LDQVTVAHPIGNRTALVRQRARPSSPVQHANQVQIMCKLYQQHVAIKPDKTCSLSFPSFEHLKDLMMLMQNAETWNILEFCRGRETLILRVAEHAGTLYRNFGPRGSQFRQEN